MRLTRVLNPLLACIILIVSHEAAQATIRHHWSMDLPAAAAHSEWTTDAIGELSDWHTEVAEYPALPLLPISLSIPAGQRAADVRVENPSTEWVELSGPLSDFQGVRRSDGEMAALRIAGELPRFPAEHLYAFSTQHRRGLASAEIAFAPLLYERTESGYRLLILRSCDIVVETEPDPGARILLRESAEARGRGRSATTVRVANPLDLARHSPISAIRMDEGPFRPRGLPSIEGSGVDLVIVCDAAHLGIFETLADYKLSLGIPTVVRDLDWIRANYPQGADTQETIRFFLQDALVKWGITGVILAGDTDLIPARYVTSYLIDPPRMIPTDAYYSCLDGDFNADGDRYFGEPAFGGEPGDDVDFLVDVDTGRLPVRNAADAQLMVDKIVAYSGAPDPDYTRMVTYLAEVLFPRDWNPDGGIPPLGDGADITESVRDQYQIPLAPQLVDKRFYEAWAYHPGSLPEEVEAVLNDMNTRAHVLLHVGHGSRDKMSCGDDDIDLGDALALGNGLDHLFNVYALIPLNHFDDDCIGEAFLGAARGGAATCVASSRELFPNTASYYMNSHFARLYADSLGIGAVFSESKNDWAALAAVEGSHRWTQYNLTLLGDPTLDIWMDTPRTLAVAQTEPYSFASDELHLAVTRDGAPLAGALVVADKAGEDRALGVTDAAGLVSLPFYAETLGEISLSAISRNDLPWFGQVAIAPASGSRLSVSELWIEDDPGSDPAVSGNADGRLDAGETVRLSLRVTNNGDTAAADLSLAAELPGGELIALVDSYTGGEVIAGGEFLDLSGLFLLAAPLELGDGLSVLIDFTIGHDGGETQRDGLDLDSHAPRPRLFAFVIDDSSGDGDGEPDAGEVYTLEPEWKNYGSTPLAGGWSAEISALDPAGQVFSGPVGLPDLALLERGSGAGISMSESEVGSPNRFVLELTGPLGESRLDTIVIRRPAPPAELFLDASAASSVIDMGWEIPDPAIAGYLVYRGQEQGGPNDQVNNEPTRHAYYRNEGLLSGTEYHFIVESVSSSGFRSAPSAVFSQATTPAFQAGWPIRTDEESLGQGSVAIGDVTGGGGKELVAPSRWLYAWHGDGSEVADGDGDPNTQGIISSAGEDFRSSVALAQVNPLTLGLEMIAGGGDPPYALHVFESDGSEAPGWPKEMPYWLWATPAAADVDGDGMVEIFAACNDGNFYAWHGDGSELIDGDDNPATDGVFHAGIGPWSRSSPAIGQLDGDSELEIVVGAEDYASLFAWNHDGTNLAGFPVTFQPGNGVRSSPAIGDLNDDGVNEIVFHCENDSLYALRNDGTRFPGFPRFLEMYASGLAPSPALCDFENDGQLEIVAVGTSNDVNMDVVVFDNAGNVLPGWPVHLEDSTEGSPVVADLDGDDELEILIGTDSGILHAFELDGGEVLGFPIHVGSDLRGTPTVDDLDYDLDVEIALMDRDATVRVWDLPSPYRNGLGQWKMFRANAARTGVYEREQQTTDAAGDTPVPAGGKLFANYPNPFNPSTRIRFATPEGAGSVNARLSIHDIRGRLVATLHDGSLPAGTIHSFIWDGRSAAGEAMATGLYFSRLELPGNVLSEKMLLMK